MLFLPIIEKTPSRRDRFPRVDTTTSNFSVPSGGGVGVFEFFHNSLDSSFDKTLSVSYGLALETS